MLQEEFQDRLGFGVSQQEYERANAVYMKIELDKDAFCADWAKHGSSRVTEELARRVEMLEAKAKAKSLAARKLADIMFAAAYRCDDDELRRECCAAMGTKRYFIRKMQEGHDLTDMEREWLEEFLEA